MLGDARWFPDKHKASRLPFKPWMFSLSTAFALSSASLPHHHYGDYCTAAFEPLSFSPLFILFPLASLFLLTQSCPLNDRISSGLRLKSSQLSSLSLLRACLIAHQSSPELPRFAKQHFKANWNKQQFTLKHTLPSVTAKGLTDKQLYDQGEGSECPKVNFPLKQSPL